jgi:uncharacterized protein (DUF433 family)
MTDDELIATLIEPDINRTDEARIRDFGVPVWALVGYVRIMNGDVAQTAEDYDVPIEAVAAALAYYRRYKMEIDARLASNAA